uniref:Uncharacterized protein n=1 Tax=Kalanchoe fedtschenkoi TaxID=63787 RepID=A0A7N0U0U5_KALFE
MVWSEMSGGREGVRSSTPSSARMEPSRSARFPLVEPQARGYRTIYCNDREANDSVRFKGNSVSTTKYNVHFLAQRSL